MIKRFLGLVLAICLMLPCISAAAEEPGVVSETYSMLAGIELLKLPDGTLLKPEENVSRKYMSMIAVKLAYGADEISMGDSYGVFNDVSTDDVLYSYIRIACRGGLMSSENGDFEPDRTVTYNETIKIIVCAAGYGQLAEIKGGYPTGYLSVAADMGITRGISYSGTKEMTVNDLCPILYKSLEADLMEISKIEDGTTYYDVKRNKSFLDRMEIKKADGIVSATIYTNISGGRETSKGYVIIDESKYKTGNTDIENYVGAEVTIWYKDDDPGEILYFAGKSKSFEEKIIKGSEITEVSGTGEITVKYKSDTKEEKVKISETAREFYNEVYNGGSELEKHIREIADDINGSMRLFDNDGDGVFDAVHLYKYKSYMVNYADVEGRKIYVKNADIVYVDLNDDIVKNAIIIRNGEVKTLADIKEEDIIQYSVSKDGKTAKIVATGLESAAEVNSEKKLEGRIISITEEDNHALINVDGLVYTTTVDFWNRNKGGLIIGRSYTFYMNADKQIAYITSSETGEKYGFLLNMAAESTIGGNIRIKLLTDDNKIVIYETTDGFSYYDGSVRKKIHNMENVHSSEALYNSATNRIRRQVIRYFVDDWNKISAIYTGKDNFRFVCVPTTEINSDGTWKKDIASNEYSDEDFRIKKIETINPLTTDIYTELPREQGGMVPVTVTAPEEFDDTDVSLQVNYRNFDIGKYIADNKKFAFFKFAYDEETDTYGGLRRDSVNDWDDKFKNLPGKISGVESSLIIDQKYLIPAETTVFKAALDTDENGNIIVSDTAEESLYKAVKPNAIPSNIGASTPFILYDIKKGNKVSTALMGDTSTLKFGGKRYEWKGVLTENVCMALNSEGEAKLRLKMKNLYGQDVEFFFEDENAKDTGCMMQYYNKNGEYIGPGMVDYFGSGGERKAKVYYEACGMYQGRSAKDLKLGDFICIKLNNKEEIRDFYIMFDGDTTRDYYEAPVGKDADEWGMNRNEISKYNGHDKDYEEYDVRYGRYGFKNIGSDGSEVSLNNSERGFIYCEIKDKTPVGNYIYTLVETRLPSWNYRDRVGSWNGSHDQYYTDESGDSFVRLDRLLDVHNRTRIFVVDKNRKSVVQQDINSVCIGDKVAMYQPMYEWDGMIVVYKED